MAGQLQWPDDASSPPAGARPEWRRLLHVSSPLIADDGELSTPSTGGSWTSQVLVPVLALLAVLFLLGALLLVMLQVTPI